MLVVRERVFYCYVLLSNRTIIRLCAMAVLVVHDFSYVFH